MGMASTQLGYELCEVRPFSNPLSFLLSEAPEPSSHRAMGFPRIRIRRKKCHELSGRCIEVVVGAEEPTTFSVHERLICNASEFFKKAMGSNGTGSKTRSVRLESEDPEIFQLYIHWLYRRSFPVRVDSPGFEGNVEYMQLAKAYVLGDMLLDADFKDAVIDAIIDKTCTKAADGGFWYPLGPFIRHVYDNTLHPSNARCLLVDIYTRHARAVWLTGWVDREDLPKEFLYDLAVSLLQERTYLGVSSGPNACTYHEHRPDQTGCYRDRLT